MRNTYAWDVKYTHTVARITVLIGNDAWCIKCGNGFKKDEKNPDELSGSRAFQIFKRLCKKHDVDLKKYEIKNGKEVKNEIESPLIHMNDEYIMTVHKHVHHLDFNSSYPTGLVITHPEFYPVIKELYDKRKSDPVSKQVLNLSIGFMQSLHGCGAKYATLARDAIKDNNYRLRYMANELINHGYKIVGYNTDGIWYEGENPYWAETCGNELGQWKNDHVNCTFRAKSDGAYEFIEGGKYTPVYRGFTTYERVKDRKDWQWGDIFKAEIVTYEFDEEKGFINYEN